MRDELSKGDTLLWQGENGEFLKQFKITRVEYKSTDGSLLVRLAELA